LRDLDRALARISEAQRRITLLIGLEGTSYEEAATILDVPVGTIRSGLSRGRKSLRELMDRRDAIILLALYHAFFRHRIL
jgi:RNA polymerase sigma-70 factor (ECF subfamily)